MSISLELSTIQYNSLQSAIINAQVEEYLRKGGEMTVLPAVWDQPKEGTSIESSFNGRTRDGRYVRTEGIQDNLVRDAAKTLNMNQVEKKLGVHHSKLAEIAKRLGFEFYKASKLSERIPDVMEADLLLVERITALRDVGLSRAQVMRQVVIGYEKFQRILREHEIDFPIMPRHLRYKQTITTSDYQL